MLKTTICWWGFRHTWGGFLVQWADSPVCLSRHENTAASTCVQMLEPTRWSSPAKEDFSTEEICKDFLTTKNGTQSRISPLGVLRRNGSCGLREERGVLRWSRPPWLRMRVIYTTPTVALLPNHVSSGGIHRCASRRPDTHAHVPGGTPLQRQAELEIPPDLRSPLATICSTRWPFNAARRSFHTLTSCLKHLICYLLVFSVDFFLFLFIFKGGLCKY